MRRPLRLEDRHSFTGRVWREYRCDKCGEQVVEDGGVALWQALSDMREKEEEERQRALAAKRPGWRFWKK